MRDDVVRVTCDLCGCREWADLGTSPPYWTVLTVDRLDKRGWSAGGERRCDICEKCARTRSFFLADLATEGAP